VVKEISEAVGVEKWDQIVGKQMLALYDSEWGRILGIKNPTTGKTFMVEEWSRRVNTLERMQGNRA
jgi:hypothetical protein